MAFETSILIGADTRVAQTNLSRLDRQLATTGNRAVSVTRKMGGAFDRLKKNVFSLRSAIVGLGAALALRQLIKVGSTFEQLRIQLKTVTGSASNAATAFERIKKLAIDTPFSVENLTKSFIRLKAIGIEPTQELMKTFGDVAAGLGRDVTDFTRAAVGAAFGETEALKSFGIAAKTEGDKISFIFKGVTTTVDKEVNAVIGALQKIGAENFAGAAQDQVNSFKGAVSNFGDAMDAFLDSVAQSGVLDTFTAAVKVAADELARLTDGGFAESFGKKFLAIIKAATLGVAGFLDKLRPIFTIAQNGFNTLVGAFNSLPAELQTAGIIGAIFFGTKGVAALIAGFGLADAAAKKSQKILDDLGVAQDSVLRDIFVGGEGSGIRRPSSDGEGGLGDLSGMAPGVADLLKAINGGSGGSATSGVSSGGKTILETIKVDADIAKEGVSSLESKLLQFFAKVEANAAKIAGDKAFAFEDLKGESLGRSLDAVKTISAGFTTAKEKLAALLITVNDSKVDLENEIGLVGRSSVEREKLAIQMETERKIRDLLAGLSEQEKENLQGEVDLIKSVATERQRLVGVLDSTTTTFENNEEFTNSLKDGMIGLGDSMIDAAARGESMGDSLKNTFRSMVGDILKQLARLAVSNLFGSAGGGILGSLVGSLFGTFSPGLNTNGPGGGGSFGGGGDLFDPSGRFANGAAFRGGRVTAFAAGGVVNGPTLFPMANGAGLMGEAGPEAVMPLRRGRDGKLGVAGVGGGGMTILIDARGSNGDAAVEAAVERGIRRASPHIVDASVQKVRSDRQRDPSFFGRGAQS
jgi:hypothetical protein